MAEPGQAEAPVAQARNGRQTAEQTCGCSTGFWPRKSQISAVSRERYPTLTTLIWREKATPCAHIFDPGPVVCIGPIILSVAWQIEFGERSVTVIDWPSRA
jgi:hypothetical protein